MKDINVIPFFCVWISTFPSTICWKALSFLTLQGALCVLRKHSTTKPSPQPFRVCFLHLRKKKKSQWSRRRRKRGETDQQGRLGGYRCVQLCGFLSGFSALPHCSACQSLCQHDAFLLPRLTDLVRLGSSDLPVFISPALAWWMQATLRTVCGCQELGSPCLYGKCSVPLPCHARHLYSTFYGFQENCPCLCVQSLYKTIQGLGFLVLLSWCSKGPI